MTQSISILIQNHPPHKAKHLPAAVNKRLNEISCDQQSFDAFKGDYEKALGASGLRNTLTYRPKQPDVQNDSPKRKNWKKDIIWFNPPYCRALTTNIGKEFLKLIDKNFPTNHHLHKIINRKKVKLSYSCTENMKMIIQGHNNKIIRDQKQARDQGCNCRNKQECPVPGQCCQANVVYKAKVTDVSGKCAEYIGSTENTFKLRYNNHTKSFRNEQYKNETTLSKFLWDNNIQNTAKIEWTFEKNCKPYTPGATFCDICVSEKSSIIRNLNSVHSLNKRTDIANKCPHKKKHMLYLL